MVPVMTVCTRSYRTRVCLHTAIYLKPLEDPKLAKRLSLNEQDRAALFSNLPSIVELHRVSRYCCGYSPVRRMHRNCHRVSIVLLTDRYLWLCAGQAMLGDMEAGRMPVAQVLSKYAPYLKLYTQVPEAVYEL